jgi:penicillin-binding protein 1C
MELIYPKPGSKIFVPRDLDGKPGAALFELAHQNSATDVFWHLDEEFIGHTRKIHTMALNPAPGKHRLVLIDGQGTTLERYFEVVDKM